MIARNAIPTSHRPPLPRIDLNPVRTGPVDAQDAGFSYSPAEADRIWKLVRQTAEGTCGPAAPEVHIDLSGIA